MLKHSAALSHKSGIYEIRCVVSGKSYVGSTRNFARRWEHHRSLLKRQKHPSPRLQQAWNKHGSEKFVFSILEECSVDDLFVREQCWIDLKKRDYNSMPIVRVWTKEMVEKRNAAARRNAELRTHCPRGHEYAGDNLYVGKIKINDNRCKACNRERIAELRSRETPTQRASRYAQMREYHMKNREAHNARMREYGMKIRKSQ